MSTISPPKPKLAIVVSFYKNPHLVDALLANMVELKQELQSLDGVKVIAINDSPDDLELREALQRFETGVSKICAVQMITNEANKGFIISVNSALALAAEERRHAVLLNSDCRLAFGALSEMLTGFDFDPMVGFVCPRSNNATLCSLPTLEPTQPPPEGIGFEQALQEATELSKYLDRYSFVPTGVGFCLLIRNTVLMELGLLDTVYGRGYNEENDYVYRANRVGFSVILANRAFVYHEGSTSFGHSVRAKLDRKNARILNSRYPEYPTAILDYFRVGAIQVRAIDLEAPEDEANSQKVQRRHGLHAHDPASQRYIQRC